MPDDAGKEAERMTIPAKASGRGGASGRRGVGASGGQLKYWFSPKSAPVEHRCSGLRSLQERFSMAGHSKWANIQHRKGRQDEKRGKEWTRVIREIMVAARTGGGDPGMNPRLRLAIEKAKAVNLPADTVKRNIDKATGNLEGVTYEEIRYEGRGIGGAAVIIDTMTDNKVRTVAEVRHAFSKWGGIMGTEGSVAFQFKHVGQFVFAPGASEDKIMEVALEAGADDVITHDDGSIEVLSAPTEFEAVQKALEAAGLAPDAAEVTMRPESNVDLAGDDSARMQKLLDVIEDLDDVQDVYHNAVLSE
jgi:YebC/PmpR family DNA-binding regulatory protein